MIEARCCRGTCTRPAAVLPVILVWPSKRRHPLAAPARVQMGIPVCDLCKRDIKIPDLISRDAWAAMAATFIKQRNGIPPVLSTARIEWIPLGCREAREFIASTPMPERPEGGLVH